MAPQLSQPSAMASDAPSKLSPSKRSITHHLTSFLVSHYLDFTCNQIKASSQLSISMQSHWFSLLPCTYCSCAKSYSMILFNHFHLRNIHQLGSQLVFKVEKERGLAVTLDLFKFREHLLVERLYCHECWLKIKFVALASIVTCCESVSTRCAALNSLPTLLQLFGTWLSSMEG